MLAPASATYADKFTHAIVAKAFRGELVPTEAELARQDGRNYKPAAALLARILATRAANDDKPPLRPRASAATPSPATANQGRRKKQRSNRLNNPFPALFPPSEVLARPR